MATTARRTGTETSETRLRMLDITEQVMVEDGYAAVSSRRIAKEAGVTPALVHYYFPTLDDLFLEVVRRRARQQSERQERILDGPQPLRAIWAFSRDQVGTGLLMELMALANHRKTIGKELAQYAEQFRLAQLEALTGRFQDYGIDPEEFPPEALLTVMAALSRTVVMEESLGMSTGLAATDALVERFLERYEGPPERGPKGKAGGRSG
jgi:AcrR family transcriptional regulator